MKVTEDDLSGLSAKELTYARNEIYARHGYVFKSSELNAYFGGLDWYSPGDDNNKVKMNKIEKDNIDYIKKYQQKNGLEYTPQ